MRVAVGREHFDDALADVDDRDIEGAAAEVIDHNLLLFVVVEAVSERCRRRLVDDTLDFKARNLACVLGCLTLRVVKVCRNRDDRFADLLAEVALRVCLQLLQNHRRNLLRRVALAVDRHLVVRAHVALNRSNRAVRVRDCLALRRLADQTLAGLCECDHRRCGSRALAVRDYDRLAALHDCHTAVRCTKVNTDNLTHCLSS